MRKKIGHYNFKLYDDNPTDQKINEFLHNQKNSTASLAIKTALAIYINAMGTDDILTTTVKNTDMEKIRQSRHIVKQGSNKKIQVKPKTKAKSNIADEEKQKQDKSSLNKSKVDNNKKKRAEKPVPQDVLDDAWNAELLRSDIK